MNWNKVYIVFYFLIAMGETKRLVVKKIYLVRALIAGLLYGFIFGLFVGVLALILVPVVITQAQNVANSVLTGISRDFGANLPAFNEKFYLSTGANSLIFSGVVFIFTLIGGIAAIIFSCAYNLLAKFGGALHFGLTEINDSNED